MYRDNEDRDRARLEAVEQQLSEAYRTLSALREQGEPPLEWLAGRAAWLSRAAALFREEVKRASARGARPERRARALPRVLVAGALGLGLLGGGVAVKRRPSVSPSLVTASSAGAVIEAPTPLASARPADPPAPDPAPVASVAPVASAAPVVEAQDRRLSAADYESFLALSRGFFRAVRARSGGGLAGVSHPVFGLHVLNTLAGAEQPQREFEPVEARQCFQPPTHEDCVPCGCSPLCSDAVAPFGALPFEKATSVSFNEPEPDVATDEWRAWATFTLTNPLAAPGASRETVVLRFEPYEGRWWVGAAVRVTR